MRRLFRGLFPIHAITGGDRTWMLLMWLLGVLQGVSQAPLSSLVPFTRVSLGLTAGGMSLVLAVTRVASLGAILFSWWGDHSGRRKPALTAFVVLVVASGLTALTTEPAGFTITQSVVRIGTTSVGTLAVVLIAEAMAPRVRAFAVGLYSAAVSLGAGIGQLMLPVAERGPEMWRVAFALPLLGLAFLPILVRVKESPLVKQETRVPIRELLLGSHKTRFWIAGMAALLAAGFPSVALAFTTERLVTELGMSATRAVVLALVPGTIGGLGFWIGGRLADEWGRRPTTVLALGCSLAGGLVLFRSENEVVLFLAIMVGAFGSFSYVPAASTHRTELFPTEVRATGGTGNAYLATIGSAIGLALGAVTIDRWGLDGTMTALAVPSMAAMILTLALPETKDQALEASQSPG